MDIRKVKKLIEMLEESGIDEIEIHEGDDSVRVSRNQVQPAPPAPATVAAPVAVQSSADSDPRGAAEPAPATESEPGENLITAPMVGIYYEAPAPDKPVFVKVGQHVRKGDVLCIIEAMKIMNHVEAEQDGVIHRILVVNGEPVEYGQPLFAISAD